MVVQILPVPVIALVTDRLAAMADALSGMVHIDLLLLLYWCCSQKTVTEVDWIKEKNQADLSQY
jgi:hypothetical protein